MTAAGARGAPRSSGFTLIEMLVALLLFALISVAGIGLVETVIGVERRTGHRAERLAEIQRALFLVRSDFEQLSGGPVIEGDTLRLVRNGRIIGYRLAGGALHRQSGTSDAVILAGIGALRFRFVGANGVWSDLPFVEGKGARPRGLEVVAELAPDANGPSGTVRQVIDLPAEP